MAFVDVIVIRLRFFDWFRWKNLKSRRKSMIDIWKRLLWKLTKQTTNFGILRLSSRTYFHLNFFHFLIFLLSLAGPKNVWSVWKWVWTSWFQHRSLLSKTGTWRSFSIYLAPFHSRYLQEPYNMPAGFEWCALDLNDPAQLQEMYTLLTENYVEDDDAHFR